MREYLAASIPDPKVAALRERPSMFIFDNCHHFIDLVPTLARDEDDLDDVDPDSEDHIADEARYRVANEARGGSIGKTVGT